MFEMKMSTEVQRRWLLGLAVLIILTALGATSAGYTLDWWTVEGGGGASSGGNYRVNGAVGQPDAGALSGGDYRLEGGEWGSASNPIPEQNNYLPMIMR